MKKNIVLIPLLLLTMACGLLDSIVWEAEPLPTAPPLTAPPEERADSPPANVSPLPESPVDRVDSPAPAPPEAPAAGAVTPIPAQSGEATRPAEFIRRHENLLVVGEDNQIIWLRGINLDNQWVITPSGEWTLDDDYHGPGTLVFDRYGEGDFQHIAAMGMNVIRFNLNYQIFEDKDSPYVYKPEGWTWLDQNIEWARANDLYLILDMVVPPGGYQPGGGIGAELWDDPERGRRYVALWQAIAGRYRDEPVIAGYDLLNEPSPTESAKQWQRLAGETIAAIRSVDPNHLIVLEPVNWIVNAKGESPDFETIDMSAFQFLVHDDNVMYDFHFYQPFEYTHQLTPWTGREDGGKYPDESVVYEGHDGSITGVRNKDFLEIGLMEMTEFGRHNNVPMFVGEFTPSRPTFRNGKGGLTYVEDVLDLFVKHDLHFTYYTYDGLYFDYEGRPDKLPELIDLLTNFYSNVAQPNSDVSCPADCVLSPIIASVSVGETVSLPYFGDLWANTWAGNDQVYFSWGDGSGMADCMPSLDGMNPSGFESCAIEEDPSGCFRPSEPYSQCDYLDLLCRSFDCNACFPLCPDTPAGLLVLRGEAPYFEPCEAGECIVARHIPNSAAAVAAWQHLERDDKPSSLLFVDGLLVLAGHWPAGAPAHGYIAWSDGVNPFTEVAGSPWTGSSPFKILMFIQMGQAFRLSEDGWVYALGISEEFNPEEDQPVYLARVPRAGVIDYSQYEYFTGTGGGGEPEWSPDQAAAAPVPGLVSNLQGSAMYHEGIGRYLFIGGKGERPGRDDLLYPERGALFEAPAPWGPWMMVATLPNNWPSTLLTKDAGPTHVYMTRAGEPLGYNLNIIRLDFSLAASP